MKLHYYPETDSLYIDLSHNASAESIEVAEHIVLDLDQSGSIAGIDIQHASEVVDLSGVSIRGIPTGSQAEVMEISIPAGAEVVSHRPAR